MFKRKHSDEVRSFYAVVVSFLCDLCGLFIW